MDVHMRHADFFGGLEESVQVCIVRVDAAIRYLCRPVRGSGCSSVLQ
jgi:hypothetical protein